MPNVDDRLSDVTCIIAFHQDNWSNKGGWSVFECFCKPVVSGRLDIPVCPLLHALFDFMTCLSSSSVDWQQLMNWKSVIIDQRLSFLLFRISRNCFGIYKLMTDKYSYQLFNRHTWLTINAGVELRKEFQLIYSIPCFNTISPTR